MVELIVNFLNDFPRSLATIILASLPVTELRLSIPVATTMWELPLLSAMMLSMAGNALPFFPLFFGLKFLRKFVANHLPIFTQWLDKYIDRAHNKIRGSYEKYGALALCFFVAIPLPMTGVWTATLAAVALKVQFKYAASGILSGVILAGFIVSIITATGIKIL